MTREEFMLAVDLKSLTKLAASKLPSEIRSQAEDVAQEAILVGLRHCDNVAAKSAGPWLNRVTVNCAYMAWRKAKALRGECLTEKNAGIAPALDQDRVLNEKLVERILGRIQPRDRVILRLWSQDRYEIKSSCDKGRLRRALTVARERAKTIELERELAFA